MKLRAARILSNEITSFFTDVTTQVNLFATMILRRYVPLVVLLIAGQSCSSGNSPEISGLSGNVVLVDSAGNPQSNPDAITITLTPSDNSSPIVTHPDARGNWNLTNVPAGSFAMTAERSGYSQYYWFGTKSAMTANTVEDGVLVRTPRYLLALDTVRFIDSSLFINAHDPNWSPSTSSHLFLIYCDSSATTGSLHTAALLPAVATLTFPSFTPTITVSALRNLGFRSGQTIHISGSAISPYEVTAPLCYDASHAPLFVTAGERSNVIETKMP